MSSSNNKLATFVGWIMIIIIPLAILLVAIEIALRLLFPQINILTKIIEPTSDSRNYILKADTNILYQGLYEKHEPIVWEINQQGLRSDRIENSTSDKFRILTYGDSETYGWSIDIKDSWQRQMEKIDTNVEVLNFGIPGYNVVNIADHMQYTLPDYNPNMLIYFFNKNDYYPAFKFNPATSRSYAYLAIRMIIYRMFKQKRKAWRNSAEGSKFVQEHINRMVELSQQYNAPLYILVMHWKYAKPISIISETQSGSLKVLNIEDTVEKFEKADAHLTKPAHAALAKYICKQISQSEYNKCTPSDYEAIKH